MNKVKLKIYLDTSAINRIFDDQTQARIYLESISMQLIFLLIENKGIEIVSSDALVPSEIPTAPNFCRASPETS